ncbi:MAG: two-component system regulatory protein YycI [Bacillota bacterium]|nr:two-component system regulatory protein YycI [Bacillota bacterium]
MDWSKIKTIFIVTFLTLDVYLLYQFMKIRDANKYEVITETSLEDKLKADDIKYVDLPKMPITDQYVSAKPKNFKKEELGKLKGQTVTINNGSTLDSIFIKPVQLPDKFDQGAMATFLKENILYGDHYQYWEKSDKKITYYQQYEGKQFFKNIQGMLTFTLNENNQIVSYEQTYLEGLEKLNKKEEVLPPLNAIETLHQNGKLQQGDKITNIELGYSTFIPLSASQVLTPTWHIVVDNKESLFVNAFEGQIMFDDNENKAVE